MKKNNNRFTALFQHNPGELVVWYHKRLTNFVFLQRLIGCWNSYSASHCTTATWFEAGKQTIARKAQHLFLRFYAWCDWPTACWIAVWCLEMSEMLGSIIPPLHQRKLIKT